MHFLKKCILSFYINDCNAFFTYKTNAIRLNVIIQALKHKCSREELCIHKIYFETGVFFRWDSNPRLLSMSLQATTCPELKLKFIVSILEKTRAIRL